MMEDEYKPKYRWGRTWPGENGLDGKPLQDFIGFDGEVIIGRIRLEDSGPLKGQWQWSGQGPFRGIKKRLLPHQGYAETAREASRMAEDYYHQLLALNGLRHEG
ncbi:hypothetical protein [Rhizobium sp. BK251]|uniref:hypothetical protein n=1 Tax=Rhizobium sp. BK251 TaxID=2512125 RepID=UPI001FE2420F|nr:hypothetical protein [Rhizobium sp. BK251]